MKKIIKKIILNKLVAIWMIKPVLRLHSWCYKLAGRLAIILNNGVHPKHRILKYKEWFCDNIEPGDVVLDIGCNCGMLSLVLAQKAEFVYGIEIDEKNIALAKSRYAEPNMEYICADATTYNYASCKPINCIILSNVLEHIDQRVNFLKDIIHKVKWADNNCKRLLLRVPMIDREWITLYKKELGLDYRLDSTHHTEYTFQEFEEELKQAGIVTGQVKIQFGEIYAVCEAV